MKFTLLCVVATLLLMACTSPFPSGGTGSAPTPPSSATVAPRLTIRIRNQSTMDFEQISLSFPDRTTETIFLDALPAGATSEPYPVTQTFQSAQVDLTAEGHAYTLPAYDLAQEPPITSGAFIYSLNLQNDQILLSFEASTTDRETVIAPIVDALKAADATVRYEPSIPRDMLFDALWGEPVSAEELLNVNGERVKVFVFADDATAEKAAHTIQPGGTLLTYTRPDGTVAREFHSIGAGQSPLWWRHDRYLVLLGDLNVPALESTDLITRALGTEPLNATPNDDKIWLRVYNRSDSDFDSVSINEVNYGALPQREQSAYAVQPQLYRYAPITIEAGGATYSFFPIDYVGETPFPSGAYTYVLDLYSIPNAPNQVGIAYLQDGALLQDTTLLGKWVWDSATALDGTTITPASQPDNAFDADAPYLEFTDQEDPNDKTLLMVTGYSGCNGLGGNYQLSPDHAVLLNLATTEMLCEPTINESEQFLMNGLRKILYYSVEGDTLRLNTQDGTTFIFTRE